MQLTIIIPVFNEVATIEMLLKRVKALDINKEILVVDDGSTDGTTERIRGFVNREADKNLHAFFHQKNQGKGAAIRTALPHACGDFVIIQDGDLEYDPQDIHRLLDIAQEGHPVVYGSRVLGHSPKSYWRYYIGGRTVSFVANLLYRGNISDEPTCYKLFRRDVLQAFPLACTGFEFCPEVTARTFRAGLEIVEVPIHYVPRKISDGKKIRGRDGLLAIWTLIKFRFKRRAPIDVNSPLDTVGIEKPEQHTINASPIADKSKETPV